MAKYPHRSNLPESHTVHLLLSGGNGSDLTVEEGVGDSVTVVRTGEGAYTVTITGWNPGVFKGMTYTLGAATPSDVAGHAIHRDTPVAYDPTTATWTLPILLVNASETADDLLVNEYLDLALTFGITE